MPSEVKSRFLLLYGSQRGQAQSIAEEIADQAAEHGLVADLFCLTNKEKVTLEWSEVTMYQTITFECNLVHITRFWLDEAL